MKISNLLVTMSSSISIKMEPIPKMSKRLDIPCLPRIISLYGDQAISIKTPILLYFRYPQCFIRIVFAITEDWANTPVKVRPSSSLTLVGYPYGYYDKTNSLPIWKTGSVASEPSVDFDNKPLFVIDISAFPGMSGSPAFVISNGTYETEGGGTTVGSARKFMGIYASMQMLKERKFLEQLDADQKKPGVVILSL